MAWVKISDDWPDHPKNVAAGKDGRALALTALCWVAKGRTDGRVPRSYVPVLELKAEAATGTVRRLLELQIWHQRGDRCDSEWCAEAGLGELDAETYLIHDYLEHNPSKAYQEARAEGARKAAAARHGANGNAPRSAQSTTNRSASRSAARTPKRIPVLVPVPVPQQAVDLLDRQTLARGASESVGLSETIEEALSIHAQVVLATTNPAKVRNPIAYTEGIRARAASERRHDLEEYLREHPQATSLDLAAAVFEHDPFDLARINPRSHTA